MKTDKKMNGQTDRGSFHLLNLCQDLGKCLCTSLLLSFTYSIPDTDSNVNTTRQMLKKHLLGLTGYQTDASKQVSELA